MEEPEAIINDYLEEKLREAFDDGVDEDGDRRAAPVQPLLLDRRLVGPPPTTHPVPR